MSTEKICGNIAGRSGIVCTLPQWHDLPHSDGNALWGGAVWPPVKPDATATWTPEDETQFAELRDRREEAVNALWRVLTICVPDLTEEQLETAITYADDLRAALRPFAQEIEVEGFRIRFDKGQKP